MPKRLTNRDVLLALNHAINARFSEKAVQLGRPQAEGCRLCQIDNRQDAALSAEGQDYIACSACPIRIYTGATCMTGKYGDYVRVKSKAGAAEAIRAVREELKEIRLHFFGENHAELLKK